MKLEHPLSAQTIGAGPNVLDLTGTGPIQTSPPVVEATTLVRERRMQFANGTPVRRKWKVVLYAWLENC